MDMIKNSIGYLEHHAGLSIILLAWISVLVAKFQGAKVRAPGHFFLIYGIGCLLLAWSMYRKSGTIGNGPMLLELAIGLVALYLYM